MNYLKYHGKGLTGLVNLGNTCYINSSLQVISHIPELNIYIHNFLKTQNLNEIKNIDIIFLHEWIELYKLMWKKNVIISPNRFLRVIQTISQEKKNILFSGFMQNDSTEFIYFIIQIFHNALQHAPDKNNLLQLILNKYQNDKHFSKFLLNHHKNEYSMVDSLFAIYTKIDIIDYDNENVLSSNYENFYILDLAITQLSIKDCLNDYFNDELMNKENDNQYFCDKDNKLKDVVKRTSIYHCPDYLIIQLKRWNQNLKKNQRIIHYNMNTLDLDPYLHDSSPFKQNSNYSLFGIINHSGNVFGGHYFSFIKNFNNNWYEFNDTTVKEIHITKLLSNKNYCFIYRRNK